MDTEQIMAALKLVQSVNFLDLAGEIDPQKFIEYLEETGWVRFSMKRRDIAIFQREREQELFQITIPIDKNLADFQWAMYSAASTAAEVEAKSAEEIILRLADLPPTH